MEGALRAENRVQMILSVTHGFIHRMNKTLGLTVDVELCLLNVFRLPKLGEETPN